jgi:hypothetical protein
VPHISLVLREMWDTTNLNPFPSFRKKHVERCGIPYLAKNERDMGRPTLCRRVKRAWATRNSVAELHLDKSEFQPDPTGLKLVSRSAEGLLPSAEAGGSHQPRYSCLDSHADSSASRFPLPRELVRSQRRLDPMTCRDKSARKMTGNTPAEQPENYPGNNDKYSDNTDAYAEE